MNNNAFYKNKFIRFLKDNNLYEYRVVNYFFKYATFSDLTDFDLTHVLDNWVYIYNRENKLVKIFPCTPALKDDRSVLFNILCYIKMLHLLLDINFTCSANLEFDSRSKTDEFNCYDIKCEDVNEFILLFYYGMLYTKSNPDMKLYNCEKKLRKKILKNGSDIKQAAFKFCEQAIEKNDDSGIDNITRLVKKKLKPQKY